MIELYLSYARVDRARVATLAHALEAQGFSVWWDAAEQPGETYAREAPARLAQAQIALALWSKASVQQTWVLDEAAVARDAQKLVNVSLDGALPPAGFAQLNAFDLATWNGDPRDAAFQRLCAALDGPGSGPSPLPVAELAAMPQRPSGGRWRLAVLGATGAALLVGVAMVYNATRPITIPPPLDGDTDPPGMAQSYGLEADDITAFGAHDLIRLALARAGLERIEAGAADGDVLGLGLSCISHTLGEGAPADPVLARAQCEAAAAAGSSLGALMLARLAEAGEAGLTADAAQAYLDQAGAGDDPRALTELARRALAQDPPDTATAMPLTQRAADMGHHPAQMLLGWIYETGAMGSTDLARAYAWYDEAAQKAYPPALTASARLLEAGLGAPIDLAGARSRYEEAASRGDAEAAYYLALMLDQGRGGPQDPARAITLMRTAAAANHPGAAEALSAMEAASP
jgi:TPR repeat protein